MLILYAHRASWIAGVTLPAAFILTFWSGRNLWRLAAALYSAGTLLSIGLSVYVWVFASWMNYHLTDAPSADTASLFMSLPLPTALLLYGVGAVTLLWPGIPQERALRFGKLLHLVTLPLLASLIFASAFLQFQGQVFPELRWLVYGPLWFHIRESYPHLPARATWNHLTD